MLIDTHCHLSKNDYDNLDQVVKNIDGYLIEELGKNTDAMLLSTYLYQDRGGKLCFGPVWDFDIATGNSNYGPGNVLTCCPQDLFVAGRNWIKYLLEYDEFKQLVGEKLLKYQTAFEESLEELDVDKPGSLYDRYGETFERNFVRFNELLGHSSYRQPKDVIKLKTNKEHIEFLHDWLSARNEFLLDTYKIGK